MTRYHIPSVASSLKLERRCPHCHRSAGRIHSRITRRGISDPKVETIAQRRMKCPSRLEGVGHVRQRTGRLICVGVFSYMLGLSYRGVEQFLAMFGWRGSKSSICGVKTAYATCGG